MTKSKSRFEAAEWLDSLAGGLWLVDVQSGDLFQLRDSPRFKVILRFLKAASGVDKTDALGALDGMVIGESPFPAEWILIAVRKIRSLLEALPDTEISQTEVKK
jgi:hypothetical protein